jgi:drug/metabolite transporter (DMT)-like permease
MPLWIPVTIAAATFQILRTSRQHQLRASLSTNAAGLVRYLYAAPLAIAASFAVFGVVGRDLPSIPGRFWPIIAAGGLAQILGTLALLRSFQLRDFALGTVYSKTEVIQVAVIAAVVLDEPLRPLGWAGAVVCMVGVAALAGGGSLAPLLARAGDPAALMGVAAGGLFGAAAVAIRWASTSLGDASALERALFTLTVMLTIQAVANGLQLAATDRSELVTTAREWRRCLPVGVLSLLGSMGWAFAVTLENAAKVRTLGQVELLIAFAISHRRFGEHHTRRDVAASVLVGLGVAVVALS